MKRKMSLLFIAAILSSGAVFSQDTSQNQQLSQNKNIQSPPSNTPTNPIENHTYYNNNSQYKNIPQYDNSIHVYRDTRLGSSSTLYNTYEKNDNGAGAITTNPNKGSGGVAPVPVTEVPVDTVINNSLQSNTYGANTTNKK